MTYGAPLWFWSLAILPVLLVLFVAGERRRARLLGKMVAPRLQQALAGNVSATRRRLRFAALLLGLAGVLLALTQPRYGFHTEERKSFGRDVIIAIDTSRSMLANDLAPSRLARAKLAAQDLLERLKGDRVGLVAFAGEGFLQAPVTADYTAVLDSLRELDTSIIPRGGTDLADAIRVAADAFGKGESEDRALVLFTDGEELDEDAVAAAKEAASSMKIFTVGLGSTTGTVIALPGMHGGTDYVKDNDGNIVKSRLDETKLRAIAEAAGGFYVHLLNGPAEMEQIARDGLNAMKQHEADSQLTRQPIERYQWPLGAGLALLILSMLPGERRRLPAAIPAAALLLLLGLPARADLPLVGKNSGVEAYEKQDYKGALDSFARQMERRPDYGPLLFDDGAAAYKSGDYDHALDSFSKALASPDPKLREKTEYNLGNTLFQHGAAQKDEEAKKSDWNSALQHYEQALKAEPKDENAAYNRGLVTKLLQEMKMEKEKKQQQKEEKKKDGDKEGLKEDPNGDKKMEKPDPNGKDKMSQQQQGESKDGGKKEGQKQDGEKRGGQPSSEKQEGEKKDGQGQNGEQKEGEGSKPDDSPDRKLDGKIGAAKPGEGKKDGEPKESAQQAEARQADEEAKAASEGVMTQQQAKNLLDSMRAEDRRVRLYKPGNQNKQQKPLPLRDW